MISINTVRLGEHLPLLDLLPPDAPIAWVRGGDGLVGWGVHASTTVSGPNRFNDARTWWHNQVEALSVADAVHASGTGPVLFTSFSFSESEESVLVIPKVIVGQRNGKSWLTWIGDIAQPILPTEKTISASVNLTWQDEPISKSDWEDQVIKLVREIQSGNVDKVVLARDQSAKADSEIDVRSVLRNLAREYPSTWNFAVAGLVGATPELLLRLSKGMVTSRVLAGTISKTGDDDRDLALAGSLARSSKDLEEHNYAVRSVADLVGATPELLLRLSKGMVTSRVLAGTISKTGDDERDLALAGSLARSSKDLEEHNYAVRSVADALEPFCSSTNVPESPFVLHLTNVMHLATDVTGALVETTKQVDSFTLL